MRSVVKNCVKCARWNARPIQPLMGDLPKCRVTPNIAFSKIGLDYAGYFNVKTGPRRNSPVAKGYLLVIVCLFTKACHLEFVSDLSCDAFFAAFDRFVSRRGLPSLVMSDQGRTYIGAANKLKELQTFFSENKDKILSHFSEKQIEWNFIPVYSPEKGGLWEAAVKSSKLLLKKIIGDQILNFEEYSTVFSRMKAYSIAAPCFQLQMMKTKTF